MFKNKNWLFIIEMNAIFDDYVKGKTILPLTVFFPSNPRGLVPVQSVLNIEIQSVPDINVNIAWMISNA